MNIFYLANNENGWRILKYLKENNEKIIGLAIHPDYKAKFKDEIISVSGLPEDKIFDGSSICGKEVLEKIRNLKADIAVSINFDYILTSEFIDFFPYGCINLHTGYLPYNRGAYPNVWAIVDGTPAGVTLHYIDAGIDTGQIISQKEVVVNITDTGKILYEKLEEEAHRLFIESWPLVKDGKATPQKQANVGTFHKVKDTDKIDKIEPDKFYKAIDLINIIRARTFPPYKGAYLEYKDEKIYLELKLYKEDS